MGLVVSLNKNGRSGRRRSGHAQEVSAPMPDPGYTLAQDALDRETRHGRTMPVAVAARCVCGDDLDGRMRVVRDRDDRDGALYDTVVEAEPGTEDGPSVIRKCFECDRDLVPDVLILRDRRRRCEREVAELRAVA